MKKELIDRLIGTSVKDISYWEAKYPKRPDGQIVTRVAPSPTGYMHIGGVFQALINKKFAEQNNGVFMLRIEDTDTKREVAGATDLIINSLNEFGLTPDEGPLDEKGNEKGIYGSYFQSHRGELYQSGVKLFLEKGLAYPCFASEEELEAIRQEQTALKLRPGYYGKWAKYRNLTEEQIAENLDKGLPFIFRFKASGDGETKRYFEDLAKGKVQMPESDMDIVIMKSDGLPTYHFAHLMDDHFMGTTHVIRADEWLASLPLHVQLFECVGWKVPNYIHTAPIQKLDDGNRRKLSKRKDPEAAVSYYFEQGYPIESVKEYLLNLANSSFEDFKKENPVDAINKFEFKIDNLNVSGALLDFKKLENIAKEFIATLSSDELYNRLLAWAEKYGNICLPLDGEGKSCQNDLSFCNNSGGGVNNSSLLTKLETQKDYIKSILAIERDGVEKVRKDFYAFSKIGEEISFFFDDEFNLTKEEFLKLSPLSEAQTQDILNQYIKLYDHNQNKDDWFATIKTLAEQNGFAKNPKEKEKNPDLYKDKGTVADIATILRLAITTRTQSPDLHAIMQILGKDRVIKRLSVLK